jgi:hypothetical protein
MFSELPKLFDRNFAIAYFLPVSIFLAVNAWVLDKVGYWAKISAQLTGDNALINATLGVLIAWIGGILLMVLNRDIYRFLEGYGKYNPLRWFENKAKAEFIKKEQRLTWLDEEYSKPAFTADLRKERTELMEELAQRYPDQVDFVLPTAFGNALRAFEVYPRVMYGFESIEGWSRILAVLPKEYRELIDDAKSQVDWWVNLGTLSLVFLIEFWVAIFSKWGLTPVWYYTALNIVVPLIIFGLLNWFLQWRATSAVVGWGDYIKSAFDIYRFTLLESLGIDAPKTRAEEKALWTRISQATLFRLPYVLPELKRPAKKPVTNKAK